MKIRTRLEYLLAKIAGKDVDLADLTPGKATSVEEELLLEIADRIGDAEAPAAATATKAGVVKMAANVPAAASAPTKDEFNALISALVAAGIMAAPASQG